ncbi:MAG: macro domain-containing protein [Sedimenticola sp.]
MIYTFKRWLYNFKSIIADFVTGIGLFWLFVEMASYSTDGSIDTYLKNVWLFSIASTLIIIFSLVKNKPKTSFIYKLRDKDNFIEIKVGDAFKNTGALIIPFNDCFDVSLGGNVRKAKSLQNRLISDFYSGKEEHLATDIAGKVDLLQSPHDIGTTIEIDQKGKIFYLLVNSRKKENNRVESSADDFLLRDTSVRKNRGQLSITYCY